MILKGGDQPQGEGESGAALLGEKKKQTIVSLAIIYRVGGGRGTRTDPTLLAAKGGGKKENEKGRGGDALAPNFSYHKRRVARGETTYSACL